jgi:enoyl-CoA hydratase/carnithine racemase
MTNSWIHTSIDDDIATIRIEREKVNALVPEALAQCKDAFLDVAERARAVVFTGTGSFFSFGFDVPHMLAWPRSEFGAFVAAFCDLYRTIFTHPTAVIAALNGHAVAGGGMLALSADARVMGRGRSKIGLNEVAFGASVFAGATAMLRFMVDGRTASRVLYTGDLYDADQAYAMGLVEHAVDPREVLGVALTVARKYGKNPEAFGSIKRLLRTEIAEEMARLEPASIEAFLEVWYSPATRPQLEGIIIR